MEIKQVLETYDDTYAEAYNEKFLTDIHSQIKTAAELKILTALLQERESSVRWLDVACGTGYYLSCFPEVQRSGLDLSPAMLKIARRNNPNIPLIQGNFRDQSLVQTQQWDVISSMWWAYSFAESITEIEQLIKNIAAWLTQDGVCFMPICEPSKNLYCGQKEVPYVAFEDAPAYGGKILITGVTWSWIEPNGKRHDNMLVPQIESMIELFQKYFQTVEVIEYVNGWYWGILAAKQARLFGNIRDQVAPSSQADVAPLEHSATAPQRHAPNLLQRIKRKLFKRFS